jgi:uncharacterized protein
VEQQWDGACIAAREAGRRGAVLALDEIQKVDGWSETVKRLWDEDTAKGTPLRGVILGSAPLAISRGLSDSLAGRFEVLNLPHWSCTEIKEAFSWTFERFLFHGGYPGAASLADDFQRWMRYIIDSLIETTISRDVLLMTRVDKPALLRRLFELACSYSGQILSYQKMLGRLLDAGNTTTLAHYLQLLGEAGMVIGLQKYCGDKARPRGSSPKLLVLNTALITAQSGMTPDKAKVDTEFRGRLIESTVGAHLVNGGIEGTCEVFYWRERSREVDFIVKSGRRITAIEVKSGRRRDALPGMEAFAAAFRPSRKLLVGADGIPVEDFLSKPALHWVAG